MGAVGAQAATVSGSYVVVLKSGADEPSVEAGAKAGGASITYRYSRALKGFAANLSAAQLANLNGDPRVLYVAADQTMTADAPKPPDPVEPQQAQILPFPAQRLGGDQSSTRSGDGRERWTSTSPCSTAASI